MSPRFELDQTGLLAHLRSAGLRDRPDLSVPTTVASWSGDRRFERVDPLIAMAHLAYLLGISPLVARPRDFPPHALVGISGSFAGWHQNDTLMIMLSSDGGPFVTEWSPSVLELLSRTDGPSGLRLVLAVCEEILDDASRLIPSARAAASAAIDRSD